MLFKKDDDRKISKISKSWTSDGSGDATIEMEDYSGYEMCAVQTVPGAEGDRTTQCPSSTYLVTYLDSYDFDWFYNEGAARSVSAADAFCKDGLIPVSDSGVITISGTGGIAQGIINIWLK